MISRQQEAVNIQKAVEYYNQIDTLKARINNIYKRYKKSTRRKNLAKALNKRRDFEMYFKFNQASEMFGVRFEKLNQIINGEYSLKIPKNKYEYDLD